MNDNLWNDQATGSGSTQVHTTTDATTTDSGGEESPLAAAIAASSWSRADIELALDVLQVVLLLVWLYLAYHDNE
ncbi:MAG: hypothetical protein ABEJ85_04975 [Haloarculaceae archaeon]